MQKIVIGTRDSALAMWQTNWVADMLQAAFPEMKIEIQAVKTKGDKILDVSLAKIGDKALFTKELEVAMLEKKTDIAVHSLKDVPTKLPAGLVLGAVCKREVPYDVLISDQGYTLKTLPQGAKVGTGSLRRKAQLKVLRPDLKLVELRGNLQTRFKKMKEEKMDGIILAGAGIKRMGWEDKISEIISYDQILPAVGQGAVAIECRDDKKILEVLAKIHDQDTFAVVTAERAFLRTLEGGCQVPIGALAKLEGNYLHLDGLVASLDGSKILRSHLRWRKEDAAQIGQELAREMLDQGAGEILAECTKGE